MEEVKLPSVFTCSPDEDALHALEIMATQNVKRLPVVEDGRLAGMISIDDLFRCAAVHPGDQERPEDAPLNALRTILRARSQAPESSALVVTAS